MAMPHDLKLRKSVFFLNNEANKFVSRFYGEPKVLSEKPKHDRRSHLPFYPSPNYLVRPSKLLSVREMVNISLYLTVCVRRNCALLHSAIHLSFIKSLYLLPDVGLHVNFFSFFFLKKGSFTKLKIIHRKLHKM